MACLYRFILCSRVFWGNRVVVWWSTTGKPGQALMRIRTLIPPVWGQRHSIGVLIEWIPASRATSGRACVWACSSSTNKSNKEILFCILFILATLSTKPSFLSSGHCYVFGDICQTEYLSFHQGWWLFLYENPPFRADTQPLSTNHTRICHGLSPGPISSITR